MQSQAEISVECNTLRGGYKCEKDKTIFSVLLTLAMLLSLVPAMGVTASAAERICKARDNNEKVTIYGDYDVGGIASIAILYKHLTQMGIDTE